MFVILAEIWLERVTPVCVWYNYVKQNINHIPINKEVHELRWIFS